MSKIWENSLECDGECGAKIEVVARDRIDTTPDMLMSLAETLGWTTRDKTPGARPHKKTTLVFCGFCQKRAKMIVDGQ